MDKIKDSIIGVKGTDHTYAYCCLKELEAESKLSNSVYEYFDDFAEMLEDSNSYIRNRALVLISANAEWDTDYKIDEIINKYLSHIMDEKPITSRQCIKSLPNIAKYKPDLKDSIYRALKSATPSVYKSSMRDLILRDINDALKKIDK